MIRAALMLLALLLLSCNTTPAHSDGVLRVGLAQMPVSLDPRYATDASSMRVQQFLHRGLVRLDEHFEIQPDLALRWEHPSPLIWHFWLQPGVKFHDGANLTSADVVATLGAILDATLASPLKGGLEAVARIEALGADQVIVVLNKPDASLLTRLNVGILPKSLAGTSQQARTTIGCGPFRLLGWQSNQLDVERVQSDAARHMVNRIRFIEVKDPVTRMLKIARGELDFTQNDLPPYLLPYLKRQSKVTIQTRPSTTFSYIGLNLQDPFLQDVRVRRALALALDRKLLKRALFADLPDLAETVLTTDHWAAAKDLPAGMFDPEQAKALLDAAGFPASAEGVRFSMIYRTSTDPTRIRLATAIAAMWEKVGVKVSIESLEWGGFYARIKGGDFQVFSLSWVGINDPDIYRWILHSSMWPPAGANRGRYANKQVDDWLDQASASQDQQGRQRLYGLVQHQMQQDMAYIPLWYEPVIAVSGPGIRGFEPQPDGSLLGLSLVQFDDRGK